MKLEDKKIAIVAANAPPLARGGVGSAHYNLFLALQQRGFAVTFFTFTDRRKSLPKDPHNMVRYKSPARFTRAVNYILRKIWQHMEGDKMAPQLHMHLNHAWGAMVVARRLKRFAPDIIILPDRTCPGYFIGKVGKAKIIHISHHNPSRFQSPLLFGKEVSRRDIKAALWLEQKGLKHADLVVCPSHYMLECFNNTFAFNKEKTVIPNLIDESCEQIKPINLHKQLGLKADAPIVYLPSTGTQVKGERYTFEIIRRIRKAVPDCAFFISGALSPSLQAELDTLPFRKHVYTPGSLPYLQNLAIAAACHLCISPTMLENYGMALCESSIFAMPVVTFNIGGNADIVTDGLTGYLVPFLDVDTLVEKAIELLQDRDKLRQMGAQGKAKILQDREKAIAAYCDIITKLLGKG